LHEQLLEEHPVGHEQEYADDDDDYPIKTIYYHAAQKRCPEHADESGENLAVLVGTGDKHGSFKIRRPCSRAKTKLYTNLTEEEKDTMLRQFAPVLLSHKDLDEEGLAKHLHKFHRPRGSVVE